MPKKKTTPKGKQTTKRKHKVTESKKKTTIVITKEIQGVIMVFFAIFLGFVFYSDTMGIVGEYIKTFMLGLTGVLTYFLPIIALLTGIVWIFDLEKKKIPVPIIVFIISYISLASLIHTISFKNIDIATSFFGFVNNSYVAGASNHFGGGVIGSLLFYPTYYYIGIVACYIFFIMVLLVSIMIITNFSIKAMTTNIALVGKSINEAVKEKKVEKKQQKESELFILDESLPILDDKVNATDDLSVKLNKNKRKEKVKSRKLPKRDLSTIEMAEDEGTTPRSEPEQSKDPITIKDYEEKTDSTSLIIDNNDEEKQEVIEETIIDADKEVEIYVKPPYALLNATVASKGGRANNDFLRAQAQKLEETLKSFRLDAKVTNICRGPVVTRYEVVPAAGVRVSKISSLTDDIALNLAAQSIRIEAPIPGKAAVGIEVPNSEVSHVYLKELVDSKEFRNGTSFLDFSLGKDIAGKKIFADIAQMPHLLVAGATGSGKSVCINSIIMSILYNATPEDVRMIMIDPKVVELSVFNNIPHLLVPVVTDPRKSASALNWAVVEMQRRYKVLAAKGIRDLKGYNDLAFNEGQEKIPQILVIIDELADLMMVAPKEIEDSICRIAQLGRAAGIHLVIATQRPSVDVITGTIKANIPSRIAFAVSSATDSRTILDMGGAEKLLGKGDMLYYPTGKDQPIRVQGCFVSEKEVNAVSEFLKSDNSSRYDNEVVENIRSGGDESEEVRDELAKVDKLLPQAVEIVIEHNQASISMLQRRMRVGYARAARLIDEMEIRNIVAKSEGPKPRDVLISYSQYKEMFGKEEA